MLFAGELEWREPVWFALAAAGAVLVVMLRIRQRPRAAMATAPLPAMERRLPITWRTILARAPLLGEALTVLLFGAALARPVHVEHDPPLRLGRDVLLCLDRSSSMAATDLAGHRAGNDVIGERDGSPQTRLDVARAVGAEFLRRRVDDRVGLVAFSRFADLVCAPTVDREAAAERLASVSLADADGPEDATAIGAAVGLCADLLQRSDAADTELAAKAERSDDGHRGSTNSARVIVLLTDGEENVATDGGADAAGAGGDEIAPLHAGQWCRELGIRVHAIVLGRGDQQPDGSFAPLDTTAVQQLSKMSGGQFFQAANKDALRDVYRAIDRIEAARFAEPGVRVLERFAWPLWAGLLLWFAAHMVRRSRAGGQP